MTGLSFVNKASVPCVGAGSGFSGGMYWPVVVDSFSDGGRFTGCDAALAQAEAMSVAGASIIDIGGESTRPGAAAVDEQQELDRVIPVIEAIRAASDDALREMPISVDTTRADVARAALDAGADIINDISGGTYEPEIFEVTASFGAPMMLMPEIALEPDMRGV